MDSFNSYIFRFLLSFVLFLISFQGFGQSFNSEVISDWDSIHANWQGGGNNFVYETSPNPDTTGINPSDSCAHFVTSNSVWDLIKLDLSEPADFQALPIYWVKILAPASGGDIWFKLENNDNTQSVVRTATPTPGVWQELKFDFSGESSGIFTRLVIFIDFDGSSPGNDWYIDDVIRSEVIPDTLAPSRPENLIATDTFPGRIRLSWDASTDDLGVASYLIFTDGIQTKTSGNNNTEINGLIPSTTYSFFVIAEDAAGNQSPSSDTISVTTAEVGNTDIIQSVSIVNNSIEQYEKVEIQIDLESVHQNPYDPKDVRVDLNLTLPDGGEIVLPCFYESGPAHNSRFLARFSPRMAGTYEGTVSVEDLGGTDISDPISFEVSTSEKDGFLHIDPASNYTLRFDSGKPFRGIGGNFAWEARIDLGDDLTYTYEYIFNEYAQNKANFVRTWMCPWNLPLEWKKTDYGRYSNTSETYNPSAMDRMDYMLEEAKKNDIYLMLALDYHGALKTEPDVWGGNNYWPKHNYHQNQGGPVTSSSKFFTDPEAKRLYKNRLRYLIARWGYHPHIAAWEFWNEVDNAQADENIPVQDVVAWHNEMASYLKEIDPFDHIVTTSISHRELEGLFDVNDIDISQSHLYGVTDQIPNQVQSFNNKYQKPYVVGEFAHDWTNPSSTDIPDYAKDQRKGIWMGMFAPTPILPMAWWWIEFDKNNLNRHYALAADYMNIMLEDPNTSIEPIELNTMAGLNAKGVKASDNYFVWLRNDGNSVVSGSSELSDLENGNWFITQYNSAIGRFDSISQIETNNGNLILPSVDLLGGEDLAFIISQNGFFIEIDTTNNPQIPSVDKLTLSPNPVESKLLVNHSTKISSIKIVDLQGRTVFVLEEINAKWVELELQKLVSGTYILMGDGFDGKEFQGKFVKR